MTGKEPQPKSVLSRSLTQEQLLEREEELPGCLGEIDRIAPDLVDPLIYLCHHPKTIKNPEDERGGSVWDLFLETLEEDSVREWYQAGVSLGEKSSSLRIPRKSKLSQRIRKISGDKQLEIFCQSFEAFVAPINRHGLLLDIWHSRLRRYTVGLNFFLAKRSHGLQRAIVLASLGSAVEWQISGMIESELQKRDQGTEIICPPEGNPLPGIDIRKLAYLLGAREWSDAKTGEAMGLLKGGLFTDSDWRVFRVALFGPTNIKGFHRLGKTMEPVWRALDEGDFASAEEELISVMFEYPWVFGEEDCLWLTGQQGARAKTKEELIKAARERRLREEEELETLRRRRLAKEGQSKTLAEYLEEHRQLKDRIRKAEGLLYSLIIREIIGPRIYLGSAHFGAEREVVETKRDLRGRHFAKLVPVEARHLGEEEWPNRLRLILLGQMFLVHPENRRKLKEVLEERGYASSTIEELFELFNEGQSMLNRGTYLQGKIRKKRRLEEMKRESEEGL